MKNKAAVLLLGLAALASINLAQAQVTDRNLTPIFPATGTWWSATDGDGRWGVVIETQAGEAMPEGQMGVIVFSYESGNIQNQAWYTSAGGFTYNPNWREEGSIGEMTLDLKRSVGGTCLLCADGENAGSVADSDVDDEARIIFLDAENAVLTVGNVGHPIVKAQWGEGVGGSSEGFWERPFQIQFEATTAPPISDFGVEFRSIDVVTPVQADSDVEFNGTSGWDVYEFEARGEMVSLTIAGPQFTSIDAEFQLYVNDLSNDARLVFSADGFFAELKVFPFSRYLFEARTVDSFVPPLVSADVEFNANALLISVPSMGVVNGSPGNGPYPFRVFGDE